jgi:hypothetical protein
VFAVGRTWWHIRDFMCHKCYWECIGWRLHFLQ